VELKIISSETGRTLPDNEQGEICARGHCTMLRYYKNPEATALALDRDGWVHTGDLAIRRRDGSFRITGRLKDMLVVNGRNYYPQDIELTVARSCAGLRMGAGTAFMRGTDGTARIVVVQEIENRTHIDCKAAVQAIRQAPQRLPCSSPAPAPPRARPEPEFLEDLK